MGSCYSCRSNGGISQSNNNIKYATVVMATTVEDSMDMPLPGNKDKRKLASAFTPASVGTSSFGFKRRIPAVVLKSTSQERTGELVTAYESKIAAPPANSVNARVQGNITRYGFGKAAGVSSHTTVSAPPDDNCNNQLHHVSRTASSTAKSQDSCTATSRFSPKTVGSKFGYNAQAHSNKSSRDNSPNSQTGSGMTRRRIISHQNDDLKNGNSESCANESCKSGVLPKKTIAKAPLKFKTQITSLPQPQVAQVARSSKFNNGFAEPRGGAATIAEPMQISSENIPDDLDSGIGNSVSDKKTEEDAETLAEIDQIPDGDTMSLASKDRTPERSTDIKATSKPATRTQLPCGIAKPKHLAAGTKILQERNLNKKVGLLSGLQQPKSYIFGGVPKPTTDSSNNRPVNSKLTKLEQGKQQHQLQLGKGFKMVKNKDDLKLITDIIASDVEQVEISAITLGANQRNNKSKQEVVLLKKSSKLLIEDILCSTSGQTSVTMKLSGGSAIFSDTESCENSLKDSGGLCSPPSDRDFLIDDEIADQPALIACQTYDDVNCDSDLTLRDRETNRNQTWTGIDEQGGLPALAQPSLSMKISRRRSSSADVLSPCSSIGSDDLMMDFDRMISTDDGHSGTIGGINERSANNAESKEDNFALQFGRFASQPPSPGVGVILEEWGGAVRGNHVVDGKSKLRSARKTDNSYSDNSNAVMGSPCGEGGPDKHRRTAATTTSATSPRDVSRQIMMMSEPFDNGEDAAVIDGATYRAMNQDLTSTKTMLLRLRRVLQEADTLNPFDSSSKKGLFMNLANNDPPDGVFMNGSVDSADETITVAKIEQENADLRRQVVFFQQQLEERDRTIKLLQQQMLKSAAPQQVGREKEFCNSACQTERPKPLLTSSLSSASNEDNAFCNTVSFKYMYGLLNVVELYSRSD